MPSRKSQLVCHCGQRFRRLGIVRVPAGTPNRGGFVYCLDTYDQIDPKPGYASYRCDGCGCKREQKLRLPAKKKEEEKKPMEIVANCSIHRKRMLVDHQGYFDMGMTYYCPEVGCVTRVEFIIGPALGDTKKKEKVKKEQQ